jgi:hypothetical protein
MTTVVSCKKMESEAGVDLTPCCMGEKLSDVNRELLVFVSFQYAL